MTEIHTLTINGDELIGVTARMARVDCPCGGKFYLNMSSPPPWIDYCRSCGRRCEANPATPSQPSLVADRREQADAIMPLIGPLIDAWDGLPSDVREAFDLESPDLTSALAAIAEAMFDPTASKSTPRAE